MIDILIVDDNDSNIYVLEILIEEWFEENNINNYSLDSAINGQETIKKLENKEYDIVFLDIMMPVMDGFEALEKIRSKNLNTNAKFIVASAVIDNEDNKNRAKKLKANAFIVKPLSYETINIMLTKYIKNTCIAKEYTQDDNIYTYFDHEDVEHTQILDAKTLLNEYPDDIIDEEDIEELHHFVSNFNQNINSKNDFNTSIDNFRQIVEKSRLMILSFSEFQNLNLLLNEINSYCYDLHNLNVTNTEMIVKYFLSLSKKLSSWFEEVFIDKTSINVLSIENTILQDFMIIKEIVSKD